MPNHLNAILYTALDIQVLDASAFYEGLAAYMDEVDPTWAEDNWREQSAHEREALGAALGPGEGRALLDCSCGDGGQAIPAAEMGWRVTGTDITAASLATARRRASEMGLAIDFRPCDMRRLGDLFDPRFDRVISCMALDNILEDAGIAAALRGMWAALKPGGQCYIGLRDMDNILAQRPHYDFKQERILPHGRVIRLEDWILESETQVVCVYILLHEDRRREGWAWETRILAWRRRALRKAELAEMLARAGFQDIRFLPQPSPWHPYAVTALKPGR